MLSRVITWARRAALHFDTKVRHDDSNGRVDADNIGPTGQDLRASGLADHYCQPGYPGT